MHSSPELVNQYGTWTLLERDTCAHRESKDKFTLEVWKWTRQLADVMEPTLIPASPIEKFLDWEYLLTVLWKRLGNKYPVYYTGILATNFYVHVYNFFFTFAFVMDVRDTSHISLYWMNSQTCNFFFFFLTVYNKISGKTFFFLRG